MRGARTAAAWGVHLLTASSAPAGVLAILAAERGDAAASMGWMAYTVAVDAVDGTLARAVGVKQVLPFFDGTRLDDLVDYVTYVIVPALFLVHMHLFPQHAAVAVAFCPVLASAYGFCRTDAKTSDHYFTGFPSYWNIVAFYLYTLAWPRAVNAAIVVAFSLAVFVPIRYLYPSRTKLLRPLTVGLGLAWGASVIYALLHLATVPHALVVASLAYPVYYVGLSLFLHLRRG
ncbi:MAG TPA: CDP-alcohol phosphatidyltransferase family protein [Candidatus Binatia bacterium]|nr:CDP-alcohol phosphatidyltransferase family protein [Candidatus Binatia bacterium]